MRRAGKKESIWSKNFILLLFINLIACGGLQLTLPLIAGFAAVIGAETAYIGGVVSAFAIAALILRPFCGAAADRFSPKLLLLSSVAGMSVATALHIAAKNLILLILFRSLLGIFYSLMTTTAVSMAADTLPVEQMGAGIGIFSLGMVASMAAAPTAGLFIKDTWGYGSLFLSAGILTSAAFFLSLFLDKKNKLSSKRSDTGSLSEKLKNLFSSFSNIDLLGYAAGSAFVAASYSAVSGFAALLGDARGSSVMGIYFTLSALSMVAVRPLLGKLSDKVASRFIVLPGGLLLALSLTLFGLFEGTFYILLSSVLCGIGYGGVPPAIQAAILRRTPAGQRGSASGVNYMGMDLGGVLGPLVLGFIADLLGLSLMFALAGLPAAIGCIFLFLFERHREKHTLGK